jgi:hypothetical protein
MGSLQAHLRKFLMVPKLTKRVLESYLVCKYKGYLKCSGQQGVTSDYESLLTKAGDEVRHKAIDKILARHQEVQVARSIHLTTAALRRGPLFVLDASWEDNLISLSFDGLKRVPGSSKLGDFH